MSKCITYQVPVEKIDALLNGEVELEDVGVRVRPKPRTWVQSDFRMLKERRFIYADMFGHERFLAVDLETGEVLWDRPYINVQFKERFLELMTRRLITVYST